MESITNFLAEHYIWFFVAAGVLTLALIGFLIDSRKKHKKEFKGEAAPTNAEEVKLDDTMEVNDIPVTNEVGPMETATIGSASPAQPAAPSAPEAPTTGPIIGETISMSQEMPKEAVINEVPVNPELSAAAPMPEPASEVAPAVETPVMSNPAPAASSTPETAPTASNFEVFDDLN